MGPTDNVLEDLYAVRASLTDGPFEYSGWTQCTCGHVYMAANNGVAALHQDDVVMLDDELTDVQRRELAVLEAIVAANRLHVSSRCPFGFAQAVSTATANMANGLPGERPNYRAAAWALVEQTIAY